MAPKPSSKAAAAGDAGLVVGAGIAVRDPDFSPPAHLQARVVGVPGAWPAIKIRADQLGRWRGHRKPPAPCDVPRRCDEDPRFAELSGSVIAERGWQARPPSPSCAPRRTAEAACLTHRCAQPTCPQKTLSIALFIPSADRKTYDVVGGNNKRAIIMYQHSKDSTFPLEMWGWVLKEDTPEELLVHARTSAHPRRDARTRQPARPPAALTALASPAPRARRH